VTMDNPVTSPFQPVAPPTKKVKALGDDTIKKRREELDRLKQKQQLKSSADGSSSGRLASFGPPSAGIIGARAAPPPAPRDFLNKGPPVKMTGAVPPPPMPSTVGPPKLSKEPVARRLDPSFATSRATSPGPTSASSRARSAPPQRPPPPPGPPPLVNESPDSRSSTPTRGFAARPPPTTPGFAAIRPPPTPGVNFLDKKSVPSPLPVSAPSPTHVAMTTKPPPMLGMPPVFASAAFSDIKSLELTAKNVVTAAKLTASTEVPVVPNEEKPMPEHSGELPVNVQTQPQTRRGMIQNLALGADTPGPKERGTTLTLGTDVPATTNDPRIHESSLLRLEKEVREHEKAKAEALRRITILEEQLQKLKEKGNSTDQLGTLVQIADSEGETAALQWARANLTGMTPKAMPSQVRF
jgi:hypothetical protein